MNNKMSLDQFRSIKEEIIELVDKMEELEELSEDTKEKVEKLYYKFYSNQEKILNSDLSDISFEEFKKNYEIWDFGENHFSARKSEEETFLYDSFVETNMNSTGYEKMTKAIKKYLEVYDSGKSLSDKQMINN